MLKEHTAIKAKPENIIRHKLCLITDIKRLEGEIMHMLREVAR